MSHEQDKFKHSKRLLKDQNAVQKQVKIAKKYNHTKYLNEPHRLAKRHAMDCGTPGCVLCGNPRNNKMFKTKDKLTTQERRLFQNVDEVNDKHSNGINPNE